MREVQPVLQRIWGKEDLTMLKTLVFGSLLVIACAGSSASMGGAGEDAGVDAEEALCTCDEGPPEFLSIYTYRIEDTMTISAGGEEKPVLEFRLWAEDWADAVRPRCLNYIRVAMVGDVWHRDHAEVTRARLYAVRDGMNELLAEPVAPDFEYFMFPLDRLVIGEAPLNFIVTLRTHPQSHGSLSPRVFGMGSVCGPVDFEREASRGTEVRVVSDR